MPEAHDPTTARTGPRQVSLRTAVGTLLLFLAFAAVARVYLVSDTPQQPGWWLLGSATCAGASWGCCEHGPPLSSSGRLTEQNSQDHVQLAEQACIQPMPHR